MTRALVIAATSFVGRTVCARLRSRGVDVVPTCRHPDSSGAFVRCDLTDADCVEKVVRDVQPQWIIQCGAATSSRDPRELYAVHVFGTLNLLTAVARQASQARVLVMGSAAEYGASPVEWLPLHEDHPARPTSFFGASKLAQTDLARAAAQEHQLRIVSVRPFNVIGPGLPAHYFATSLAQRLIRARREGAAAGSSFDVTNASATRDFVDVRDVAEACTLLLEQATWEVGTCDIFNIATGRETTLLEVATLLGDLAGGLIPQAAGEHSSRGGISRSSGSSHKLAAVTGWSPQVDWQQGIHDLWAELAQGVPRNNSSSP